MKKINKIESDYHLIRLKCRNCKKIADYVSLSKKDYNQKQFRRFVFEKYENTFSELAYCNKCQTMTVNDLIAISIEKE